MNICRTSPCSNCPYRTDAPLRLWHQAEFEKLWESQQHPFGLGDIYGCHKNDGHICIGFLIMQFCFDVPNNNLRVLLIRERISWRLADRLWSPAPLYESLRAMIVANYPGIILSSTPVINTDYLLMRESTKSNQTDDGNDRTEF